MHKNAKIYVAGHRGLVGSAILRSLEREGYNHIVTASSKDLDLTQQSAVREFMDSRRPEYVFLAAAKVGGILANSRYPADFLYQNLMIEANIIECSRQIGVNKLLFLGSTCIYPKLAPQPIKEEYLLNAPLEPTNEWYAVAKIAGIKLCQAYRRQFGCNFISAMPTNLYGPGDNFDLESSHVLPALIRKFHEAREKHEPAVTVWGSGKPLREFLYVDDCAAACLFLMQEYDDGDIVNVGTGREISIAALASLVRDVTGFRGGIVYDSGKPDGTPRKVADVSRINRLGWHAHTTLEEGVEATYRWYLDNVAQTRSGGDEYIRTLNEH